MNDTLTTNGGTIIPLSSLEHCSNSETAPKVYYLSDITPEAMVEIYNALGWMPTGNVAVKLSTGEPPASNYLRPELIADLAQLVDGTIVECNTAYGGSRASTVMHYQVAEDHGFTAIAPVQIQDENGSMTLPVNGGTVLSENYVGAAFADYDSYLILSYRTSRAMRWQALAAQSKTFPSVWARRKESAGFTPAAQAEPALWAAHRMPSVKRWAMRESLCPTILEMENALFTSMS